jgi:hypothetical protein
MQNEPVEVTLKVTGVLERLGIPLEGPPTSVELSIRHERLSYGDRQLTE